MPENLSGGKYPLLEHHSRDNLILHEQKALWPETLVKPNLLGDYSGQRSVPGRDIVAVGEIPLDVLHLDLCKASCTQHLASELLSPHGA